MNNNFWYYKDVSRYTLLLRAFTLQLTTKTEL